MELQDYQKRVIQERNELNEKINKLSTFLMGSIGHDLEERDRDLLVNQMDSMKEYLSILNERIGRFIE